MRLFNGERRTARTKAGIGATIALLIGITPVLLAPVAAQALTVSASDTMQTISQKVTTRYDTAGKFGYGTGAYASGYSPYAPETREEALGIYGLAAEADAIVVVDYDAAGGDVYDPGAAWDTTKVWLHVSPAAVEASYWDAGTSRWIDTIWVEALSAVGGTPISDVHTNEWEWNRGPFGWADEVAW